MAETYKKLSDGILEITDTPSKKISTMSKQEIEGKVAEAQTKVDHLNLDLTTAQVEVDKYNNYLEKIDEQLNLL